MKTNGYGLVAVTILRGVDIYSAGQIAGFVPAIARKLIDGGYAELYKEGLGDAVEAFAPASVSHAESQTMLSTLKATAAGVAKPAEELVPAEVKALEGEGGGDGDGGNGGGGNGGGAPTDAIKVMGIDDEVVIPADWKELHHTQVKALARNITGEIYEKLEPAVAAINTAITARTAA